MHGTVAHHGITVEHLEPIMARLGPALGLTWTPPAVRVLDLWLETGPRVETLRIAWSIEGPPHFELIEGPSDSLWGMATGCPPTLHHIARWTDHLEADVEHLLESGMRLEVTGGGRGGAPSVFAYLVAPWSSRIELVSTSIKPAYDTWLAGGELPPFDPTGSASADRP